MNHRLFISALLMSAALPASAPLAGGDTAGVCATAPIAAPGVRLTSRYITMPDGTKLAADIWLPANCADGQPMPSLVHFTRYWRGFSFDPPVTKPKEDVAYYLSRGIAYVNVDVRGTGASFGTRGQEFSVAETRDFSSVIDWIADQDFSNGHVASIGISYPGNTAENATYGAPATLTATVPRFTDFDWYTSLLFPGGLRNQIITSRWGANVRAMDLNQASVFEQHGPLIEGHTLKGVRPVAGHEDLLEQAVAEHLPNAHVSDVFGTVEARDDVAEAGSLSDAATDIVTPYRFRHAVEANAIPAYHWASWYDAGTAAGVLARFMGYEAPARYVIGAWSHGAFSDTSPYKPVDAPVAPSELEQAASIVDFLQASGTFGGENEITDASLYYLTIGADTWRKASQWPPAGMEMRAYALGGDGSLCLTQCTHQSGSQDLPVDYDLGSGTSTRWSTQIGGTDVAYTDRAEKDARLLTYDSPALTEDTEITGNPRATLTVSASTTDAAVIVYLEDVAPDGTIHMLSEGSLRLGFRGTSDAQPPFPTFGPYRAFLRADITPLTPNEPVVADIGLSPISAVVRKGHRLRLVIAGHDADTFLPVLPDAPPTTLTIHTGGTATAVVHVPVVPAGRGDPAVAPHAPFTFTHP